MKYLVYIITGVSLALATLLSFFLLTVFNQPWYQHTAGQLSIYQNIEKEQANQQIDNILKYLTNQAELDNQFYTEKEILHLIDIKKLFNLAKIIIGLSIIIAAVSLILIGLVLKTRELIKAIFAATSIAFILYLIFGILIFFSFNKLFLLFHKSLFSNNFWMLDPEVHSLIVIFPPEFFTKLVTQATLASLLAMLLLAILSGSLLLIKPKKTS